MGNSPKRLLQFILALVIMVLLLIEKVPYEHNLILVIIVFAYLALLVVTSCMGRGVSAVAGFEGASALLLLLYSIQLLINKSSNSTVTIAIILECVLGALFVIFSVFG